MMRQNLFFLIPTSSWAILNWYTSHRNLDWAIWSRMSLRTQTLRFPSMVLLSLRSPISQGDWNRHHAQVRQRCICQRS